VLVAAGGSICINSALPIRTAPLWAINVALILYLLSARGVCKASAAENLLALRALRADGAISAPARNHFM
jgi:hypothetical protein